MLIRAHKNGKTAPRILKIYDMEVDIPARRVTRSGQIIRLTPREFDLLLFLAMQRGRPVHRKAILAHFYRDDPAGRGCSNLVDVYVSFLRKKIDRGFWPRLILTRRGHGYLLRSGQPPRRTGWEIPDRGTREVTDVSLALE